MRRSRLASTIGFVPASAWACGICFEHMLEIEHPAVPAVAPVILLWYFAVVVVHFAARLPTPGLLRAAAGGLTLLGCLGAIIVTNGAFSPAMLVAGVALGMYATIKLGFLTIFQPGTWRLAAHYVVNVGFLGLTALVAVRATSRDDAASVVSLLGYPIPETGGIAVPRVLAHGHAAVQPLVAAAEAKTVTNADTRFIAFCLERICDSDAETALRRLTLNVPTNDDALAAWEPLAYAWAGCAKERAVDPLVELLAVHQTGPRARVLAQALVRTGTQRGVIVAIDHHAVLDSAVAKDPIDEKAALTLDALATASTLGDLRTLPMYRMNRHTLDLQQAPRGFEYEFYWKSSWAPFAKDVPHSWHEKEALASRWANAPENAVPSLQ